jgi:hypothetical protein
MAKERMTRNKTAAQKGYGTETFFACALLEKLFIVTPGIHYWYRLVTIVDTTNGGPTNRYQKFIIGIS